VLFAAGCWLCFVLCYFLMLSYFLLSVSPTQLWEKNPCPCLSSFVFSSLAAIKSTPESEVLQQIGKFTPLPKMSLCCNFLWRPPCHDVWTPGPQKTVPSTTWRYGGFGDLHPFFLKKKISYHKVILARWLFAGGCWLLVAGVFCLLFAVDRWFLVVCFWLFAFGCCSLLMIDNCLFFC